jgi:hypothetical protein
MALPVMPASIKILVSPAPMNSAFPLLPLNSGQNVNRISSSFQGKIVIPAYYNQKRLFWQVHKQAPFSS